MTDYLSSTHSIDLEPGKSSRAKSIPLKPFETIYPNMSDILKVKAKRRRDIRPALVPQHASTRMCPCSP